MRVTTVLILSVVACAEAFVARAPHLVQQAALRPAPAARTAEAPVMVGLVGKVAAIPTIYALMSVNEYITHRWYQHEEFNRDNMMQRFCQRVAAFLTRRPMKTADGKNNLIKVNGGGHVEHHAETYDDMSLKKDARWRRTPASAHLDEDDFRGTAFTWKVTCLMMVQMLPSTLPVMALLGFKVYQSAAMIPPAILLHAYVWNMLHPPMHGLGDVPLSFGAPSKPLERLRNTPYFKYIYENHQGHHVLGGQANYNVCCPLTDHLLGTFVPTATWVKRMRAVPGPDATERWGVPLEPKGVPQAPIIAEGKSSEEDLTPTALV